jgi:hypothetical protein
MTIKKDLRKAERSWRREFKRSQSMNLRSHLKQFLPPYMMPGNVGGYTEVTWPFWETVSFNFGTDPSWSSATRQVQSFQVTQEAGWLVTHLARKSYGYNTASELAPLQIEIRDRQSSRQFNDRSIPIQMIGRRSKPTVFPTPLLIMPNAFIDVIMSSWVDGTMPTTGSGRLDLILFGYRIRVGDEDKVLSTVFG